MTNPIRPSAAMRSYLDSVSRPPATLAGGPAPSSLAPTPLPTPSSGPVARPFGQHLLIVIIAFLVSVIIVLSTCLAYAQDFCPAKPPEKPVPLELMAPAAPQASSPVSQRTEPTPRATRRSGAASAVSPFSERHNVLLCLAVLVGVAVGRRTSRRARSVSDGPRSIEPDGADCTKRPLRRLGAASIVGAVRESNQDRVAVARIAGFDTISVADGLGGVPRGGEAAELVHRYAMARLEAELPSVLAARAEGVRTLLLNIIWGAAMELACVAARQTWASGDPGFRSTLILVVASEDLYVVVWIGDGGVDIARADGSIVHVLVPHKNPATPDLLEASLGPATEGRPAWAIAPRYAGDVLAVATDGVADRFDGELVEMITDALYTSQGDAVEAAQVVVDGLAALSDDDGNPAFTDNLTLALLTTEGGT